MPDTQRSLIGNALRTVYVCHPFASDPQGHRESIRGVCRILVDGGVLPIAPQLLFRQFMDERTERDLAMSFCLQLVALVDELWVFGELSPGMRLEIAEAHRLGIPIVDGATRDRRQSKGEPPR